MQQINLPGLARQRSVTSGAAAAKDVQVAGIIPYKLRPEIWQEVSKTRNEDCNKVSDIHNNEIS